MTCAELRDGCRVCEVLAWWLQDCGHPSYIGNYISFYFTIKAHYPHLRLIANCPLGDAAPTEIFDWHMYTSADDLFNRRNDFNSMMPGRDPQVFVSEYAVTVAAGWGNLKVWAPPRFKASER